MLNGLEVLILKVKEIDVIIRKRIERDLFWRRSKIYYNG